MAEDYRREEGRAASRALRAGVWASGALMAAGAAWAARGHGESLALLGIAVLVATPFLRVASLAAVFARSRQWRMLAVSLAVLILLVAGIVLGRWR